MNKVKANLKICMLLGLLAGLYPASAFAQTGTVSGTLVDSENGETLIGATIRIEGTGIGATTDLDGRYELTELRPGSYTFVFSYIGYNSKTVQNAQVQAGQVTKLDLSLTPEAIGLGELIVEAEVVRDGEAALLRDRQRAAAVSDAISAEVISRSASSTAADAMRKVTGASVIDGKYINIRGLEGRYINTQLNGAALPSADPDRNAVPFDLFPSALLDNIITTKTFTPDQSGDFTGGNINIGTKAFPDQATLTFSTSVSYDSQIGMGNMLSASGGLDAIPSVVEGGIPAITTATNDREAAEQLDAVSRAFSPVMAPGSQSAPVNQSYSGSYGNRFTLGSVPVGLVASLSYSQDVSGYKGGDVAQYELTGTFSETDQLSTNIRLQDATGTQEQLWGGLVHLSLKPHPKHEVGLNVLYNRSDEQSARFQFGEMPRDLQPGEVYEARVLQQVERDLKTIQGRGEHVFGAGRGVRLTWNSTVARTTQDEPDLRIFHSHYNETDGDTRYFIWPSIYAKPTRFFRDLTETSWSNDIAAALPFGTSATVKVGGSYLLKDRTFRERRFQYERTTGYEGNPDAFFGEIGIQEGTGNGSPYRFDNYIQDVSQVSNNYDAGLMVGAGFAMVDTPFLIDRLRLIGGLRAEYTDQSVSNADLTGGIEGIDLLPSANLVYRLTDRMNVRAAYGRTLARPSFREFAPFDAYDFINAVQVIGNPQLVRTRIHNLDARWEWFIRPGEILAASAFYKDFNDPIEQVLSPGAVNREVTYENADRASVAGLEFEARKRLDFAGGWLQNLQLGGNVTLTHSEVTIDADELERIRSKNPDASSTRALQGQSPYVVNLDLGYANPEQGTNVSLYYNMFGKRLNTVARSGTPNLYERSRQTVDFIASQRVPFGLEVKFSIKNLLDSRYEITQEYKGVDYYTHRYELGRSFSLGLRYVL